MEFEREEVGAIVKMLKQKLPVFQVLVGPRQVGKTTAAQQVIKKLRWPSVYASADTPLPPGGEWIEAQWNIALLKAKDAKNPVLLVLDEVQKVKAWSETIKALWDRDKASGKIQLMILGSSALLLQKGLTESLAGRFFMHRFTHWTYKECHKAFKWTLEEWLYFGGYPGAALFAKSQSQWRQYIVDSLIETVISKDVLQMQTVTKPSLLRHLFVLSTHYPAQIFSYNKMLGQLQDAGNTTTLAHYLELLESAFLVSGLQMYASGTIQKRASSPKLIVWNNALVNALSSYSLQEMERDFRWMGRLIENAVGAHLLNRLSRLEYGVYYWRKDSEEVDFVVTRGREVFALEVKLGNAESTKGLALFKKEYPQSKILMIGEGGIPLKEFFSKSPAELFEAL